MDLTAEFLKKNLWQMYKIGRKNLSFLATARFSD